MASIMLLKRLRSAFEQITWAEVSGSVGDLGTFLPLLIGLVQKVDLDLGTTLIVTGIYNIVSGLQFGIPMCVQPMKTIAAVALASTTVAFTLSQVLLAGVFVSGVVLLLGATRLVDLFNWMVPPPVVRGVQLAVGVKLAMKGVDMALRIHGSGSGSAAVHWRPWLGTEGLLLGGVALALLVASTISQRTAPRGSRDAADEDGLGPRPTDTPFEPLLQRFTAARRHGSGSPDTASAEGEKSRLLTDEGSDGDPEAGRSPLPPPLPATQPREDGAGIMYDNAPGFVMGQGEESLAAPAAVVPATPAPAEGPWGCDARGGCGGGGGAVRQPVPSALLAVVVGLLLTAVAWPGILSELRLGPVLPRLLRPTWHDFREGVLRAGLPQLPLTTLNSVIAVTQLADALFPDRRDSARWRPSAVALSVALLNLGGCWLGAMPCCHGAGGLAAQYKFGARTGAAPVVLGCLKAALGLLFGGSLMALLQHFPQPLLGALLVVSGVELASSIQHTRTPRGYTFALLTAVAILGLDNTGSGFLVGMGAVAVVVAYEAAVAAVERCWRRRRSAAASGLHPQLMHAVA